MEFRRSLWRIVLVLPELIIPGSGGELKTMPRLGFRERWRGQMALLESGLLYTGKVLGPFTIRRFQRKVERRRVVEGGERIVPARSRGRRGTGGRE